MSKEQPQGTCLVIIRRAGAGLGYEIHNKGLLAPEVMFGLQEIIFDMMGRPRSGKMQDYSIPGLNPKHA